MAFLTLTDAFTVGDGSKLGLTQLLQVPFMGLDDGAEIRLEEEILIARDADVSGLTDMMFADAPMLRGRVSAPQLPRIHIDRADGTPFTQVTPNENGTFSARVPAGAYRLRVLSKAAAPVFQDVVVTATGAG